MKFSTKVIHAPYTKKDSHNALHMPIYSNASFEFENAEDMESAFLGKQADHVYSRISNPTVEAFEHRIKEVTGALGVTALSSGMAAISNLFFSIMESGDNVITSKNLFGNTYSFLKNTLQSFGIKTSFCDLTDVSSVEASINGNTRAIYFETITNPQLEVADISQLSLIAKKHNLLLIADSTCTPPNIFRAKDFGINIEVISSTKAISSGATSLGGLILDHGNFNWQFNPKLKSLADRFGNHAFIAKLRKEISRNLGACLSPFHASLQSVGLETLDLRYFKAASNCRLIAEFLNKDNRVFNVNYPGLENSRFYTISKKQFGELPGTVVTFNLPHKRDCFRFLNSLKIMRRSTNLFDNKTLIMHPASTIYCEYCSEEKEGMGVPETLIRLSLGIEDINDLIEDIDKALK